jgi:TnpA family transposase
MGSYPDMLREVLRVPRAGPCRADAFLLNYISDIELRRTIQAAMNKREAFNLFVQWVALGGGRLLAENTRDEQRKMDRVLSARLRWNTGLHG